VITWTRDLHPAEQSDRENAFGCICCSYPTYARTEGLAMLEVRRHSSGPQLWHSPDNGRTWTMIDSLPAEERMPDGNWAEWHLGPLYLDPVEDRLVRFEWYSQFSAQPSTMQGYYDFVKALLPNTYRIFYRVSTDGGHTWTPRQQVIEDGDEFDTDHWAAGVTFGEGAAVFGEIPPYHKLADGRIMIPVQRRTPVDNETYGTIQAARLWARWQSETSLSWETGSAVPGGGCEQTIARLRDGRFLNILRMQGQISPYPVDLWLRPFSLSDDDGKTWSRPEPLCYDDGTSFTTPRAWSQLIRSTADGNLYWIANLLPSLEESRDLGAKWPGRADPRYPLQIARIDEDTLTVVRDSVTVLADREEGESKYVRFSNFYVYNDRETDEIVLLMMKSYHEDQPDLANSPHPAWRYRIRADSSR
jgi:hypothetical protein